MKLVRTPDSYNWHLELKVKDDKADGGYRMELIDLHETDEDKAKQLVVESQVLELDKASSVIRLTSEVAQAILAGKPVTVETALEEYFKWMNDVGRSPVTIVNTSGVLRRWSMDTLVHHRNVGTVVEKDISGWVNNPENKQKRLTRMLSLTMLRGFFRFCLQKKYVLSDPSAMVAVDHRILPHALKETKRKKVFTDDEIEFILAKVSNEWHKAAIMIGRDLALRISDVCSLEWDSINWSTSTITVWTGKTNSRVSLPMTKRIAKLFASLPANDCKYIFPDAKKILDSEHRANISSEFIWLFKKLGFKGYSFHSLRATYATTMANRGATVREIADALGHSNTATTTSHYIIREGAAKLG